MDKQQQFEGCLEKVFDYCKRYAIPYQGGKYGHMDKDEAIQNSIAWTWEMWLDVDSDGFDADSVELAILRCAGEACNRSRRMGHPDTGTGRGSVPAEPIGSMHDATMAILDHIISLAEASEKREAMRRIDLICRVANRLADINGELRTIAELLMRGVSRLEIASRRNVSPATITRRCEAIQELLEWTVLDWQAGNDEVRADEQAEARLAWATREFGRLKRQATPATPKPVKKVMPAPQGCPSPCPSHEGPYTPPDRTRCLDVSKLNRATYHVLNDWLESERWQIPWSTRQQPETAESFGRYAGLSVK